MKKRIDQIVSVKAWKAIKEKYKLRADGGFYPIKQWMVEEMLAWDQANNTGPTNCPRSSISRDRFNWIVFPKDVHDA
jgi:hypothetical protein